MEFEWNIFPRVTTLQLVHEVQEFLSIMRMQPKDYTGRIIFISMFNDISWGSEDNDQECELSAKLVSIYARRFSQSNSQNRATCHDRTNVPFECSGNRHTFLTWLREYQLSERLDKDKDTDET